MLQQVVLEEVREALREKIFNETKTGNVFRRIGYVSAKNVVQMIFLLV